MADGRTPRHVRRPKKAARRKASSELVTGRARLQKILAAAGLGSRRATEQYLRDGRVTVNGETAKLGDSADPAADVIAVDGEKLGMQAPSYWILHKPVGVVTTMKDPEHRPTVADLLPPRAFGVFPVGRLDVETTGLVLMTNDGAMAQVLLHPSTGGEKEYRVVLKGELPAKDAARIERGIMLEDGRTKPSRIEEASFDGDRQVTRMKLILTEGRNRQIRRMMLAIGRPVKSLARTRIGPIKIGKLRRGEARALRPAEVTALKSYVERLRAGESPEIRPAAAPRRPAGAKPERRSGSGSKRPAKAGARRSGRSESDRPKRSASKRPAKSAPKRSARPAKSAPKRSASKRPAKSAPKRSARRGDQSRVAKKGASRKKARRRPSRK